MGFVVDKSSNYSLEIDRESVTKVRHLKTFLFPPFLITDFLLAKITGFEMKGCQGPFPVFLIAWNLLLISQCSLAGLSPGLEMAYASLIVFSFNVTIGDHWFLLWLFGDFCFKVLVRHCHCYYYVCCIYLNPSDTRMQYCFWSEDKIVFIIEIWEHCMWSERYIYVIYRIFSCFKQVTIFVTILFWNMRSRLL